MLNLPEDINERRYRIKSSGRPQTQLYTRWSLTSIERWVSPATLIGSPVLESWVGRPDKQPTSLALGSSGDFLSAHESD